MNKTLSKKTLVKSISKNEAQNKKGGLTIFGYRICFGTCSTTTVTAIR